MRFVLALLFIVGLSYSSMAQTITIGPRVGVNFATQVITGDDDEYAEWWNDEVKASPGLQAGLVYNIMVSDMFSVQPELLYTRKGYKFTTDDETVIGKYSYLDLPILAKLSLGTGDLKGFVTAGPTLGYWMSGKDTYESDDLNGDVDIDFDNDNDGLEKQFEFGASIGVGMGYNTGAGELNLDVRYGTGFTSVYDSDDKAKLRNSGISISIAYLFGL
ncbi:PorT family protein [Pontibacter sp. Tf4]|uniref:porin family protein n=1 Tax=Pontibacter sp. Tf4 TaxID=2761620 RepID=UPI00162A2DAE|nr:porin family protein [Pontibacter sp. Tf4]MBB6610767.1 PorT family protein [Pontibacter sp. Tf4]